MKENEVDSTLLTPEKEEHPFFREKVMAKQHPATFLDLWKMYLYRLYHTKMIYVIGGLLILGALITVIVMAESNAQSLKTYKENYGTENGFVPFFSLSMAALWCFGVPASSSAGSSGSSTNFPLGFLVLLTICFYIGKDWQNRTFRNQILAGHSRWEMYLAAQLTSLLIAFGGIVIWETVLWGLGSALRIPAFLPRQFNVVVAGKEVSYDLTKVFCLSFFMELLMFLSTAVVACSWAFIIPNSWGALGLLYATFALLNITSGILYLAGYFNGNSYFFIQEFLLSYQYGRFSSYAPDIYMQYVYNRNSGVWVATNFNGRSWILMGETIATSLIFIGGMGYLGGLAFQKKDLK